MKISLILNAYNYTDPDQSQNTTIISLGLTSTYQYTISPHLNSPEINITLHPNIIRVAHSTTIADASPPPQLPSA